MNQPVKNRVARRTPVIMQLETLECGAACLAMILAYYGLWIPLERVRVDCGVSRDGSNAKNMARAAKKYGLSVKAYKMETEGLKKDAVFPCIIHWNHNHFVVLKGFRGRYAYINDPERGDVRLPLEELDTSFTGVCMMFEPGEGFTPSGRRKTVLDGIKQRSRELGPIAALIFLTTLITSLISVIKPGFDRVFYDRLLSGSDPGWAKGFLIFFAGFSVLQVLASLLTTVTSLKLNGKMEVLGATSFMWKVLRLPMEFFSQRMTGDVLSRKDSNAGIANTIANTLTPMVINTGMMVFYLIIMLRYSVILTVVSLISTLAKTLFSLFISKKRMNSTRASARDYGKLSATSMAGIESIETIKAAGAEDGFFRRWAGYQASCNDARVQYDKLSTYLGVLPSAVSTVCSLTVIAIGIYLTMKGKFTLGMISAFQGYLSGFLAPANSLTATGQTLQEMKTDMERIDDVMRYPVDAVFEKQEEAAAEKDQRLTGSLELKNVTFGYSALSEPLIRDFSLSLEPGSKVALVGPSGCGKSTLAKLICGLYRPWSGEILYDGKSIEAVNRSLFRHSVAVIDQDCTLFEDSIQNNIKMWDETVEDREVIRAARDARIHDEIRNRENGYEDILREGGKNLSGGQKQRLEIARVLAQNPTLCILDEATSALDTKTEYDIIRSIKERKITFIVIAHRLSTVRDCDEIIVLDKGSVAERGTHEELMALNGIYAGLVIGE